MVVCSSYVCAAVGDGQPTALDLSAVPLAVRDAMGLSAQRLAVAFEPQHAANAELLTRTHPVVAGLAGYVLDAALDPQLDGPARRCGVVRTLAVTTRTVLLLLRMRFHLAQRTREGATQQLLVEDQLLVGFTGQPEAPTWIAESEAERLALAGPDANIAADQAQPMLVRLLDRLPAAQPALREFARQHGEQLLLAHRRVRKAGQAGMRDLGMQLNGEPDVLGVFVCAPADAGMAR